jgi:sulfoxide reductase heme-binding subunit YedZ
MTIAQTINGRLRKVPAWPLYFIGLAPAGFYFYWAVTNQLGADPLKALEHQLGIWALQLLIATLLVTPIRDLSNINLIKYRRAIGLLAFFYTCLHLTTYLWLDQQWGWAAILKDITKRPYIIIGMLAFLGLVPLALTSNNISIRKLGAAGWKKLHKLVYLIAIFGAVHYLLLVKAWPLQPFVYLGIVLILVGYRFAKVRRRRRAMA